MKREVTTHLGIQRIIKNHTIRDHVWNAVKRNIEKIEAPAAVCKTLKFDLKKTGQILEGNLAIPPGSVEESIILQYGRPVLEIQHDQINIEEPELEFWKDILRPYQDKLTSPIQSVGRIELQGHPSYQWVGTGWVIAENIVITNRHVAEIFAAREGASFIFRKNLFNIEYQVSIDFMEEFQSEDAAEFTISEVLHIEPVNGPDMAFLKIDWQDSNKARAPITLAHEIEPDQSVAVIGYPARDSRTNMQDDQRRIFNNIFDIKRLAPGEVDQVFHDRGLLVHDCTTLGGCSGSVLIDIESQRALGLHFAGRELQGNYAVTADIIATLLDKCARPAPVIKTILPAKIDEIEPERVHINDMEGRNGYQPNFLQLEVPLPTISPTFQAEVAPVHGRDDGILNYTNYSVMMNGERRQAFFAAVNIDGKLWRHVTRGRDNWNLDPRISEQHQIGNELYKRNDLDRGHLVRRVDPAWGDSISDAKKAAEDTFFYTNCSPQHKNLNQKIWLGLEEYILDNTTNEDMRVCVFNGPVFNDDDMVYRGIKIPKSYWKIVAANSSSGDSVYATGYLLSQGEWLDDLEFVFGEYRTFQVPISTIENLTGLNFGNLSQDDPLQISETTGTTVREIQDFQHIILNRT
jgi:endonuclease G